MDGCLVTEEVSLIDTNNALVRLQSTVYYFLFKLQRILNQITNAHD
jgi:hypothetical protein